MTYPIQVVVRETGLSAHVLRVWEKRYRAVVPQRTATRRRAYSEADVHRLKLLRQATMLGHPIGSVAQLSDETLDTLVKTAANRAAAPPADSQPMNEPLPDSPIVLACMEAVKAFDADALNRLLERATVQLGHTGLLHQVIAPLSQRLGDLWMVGSVRMSHEHFATALIRGFLLNPGRQYAGTSSTWTLVAATPQGQLHELGAVMTAALAAEQGWRAVYLGPSLPAAEIAGVASQNEAQVVALSLIYPDADPNVERELHDLRRFLPNKTILIGGRAAERYRSSIEAIGALLVKDLNHFQLELANVRANQTRKF
ncbi:MAG: MerR family transcriptional regulator [Verrucomicrobia bacterium]|nr:MerR family transcriptional regulator [Verrucomicrobiota bacterium]MBV8376190.1 MerR family transcriptional regulator [Verrucomicrobiota bacterium]